MDFLKNFIKRTVWNKSRYLDEKEKPKKTKDRGDNKRKSDEKTRESDKRSYKKENRNKIRKEEKGNMEGKSFDLF